MPEGIVTPPAALSTSAAASAVGPAAAMEFAKRKASIKLAKKASYNVFGGEYQSFREFLLGWEGRAILTILAAFVVLATIAHKVPVSKFNPVVSTNAGGGMTQNQ
jgi:hypothetical protein